MQKVSDLFKAPGQVRAKVQYKEDYTRGNVWANYGIQASNYHRQEQEKPLKTLMNSDEITECKVITYNGDIQVSISACNRIEKIEINNELSLRYEDCTKIEDVTDNSKYDMYKANNYKVYNLYRYNFVANAENIHMVIAVR